MKPIQSLLALAIIFLGLSTPPAQEKKLTTVNVGYSAISGSFAPLWVGYDHGLFAKHGLDLKMAYIQGNRVMLSALKKTGSEKREKPKNRKTGSENFFDWNPGQFFRSATRFTY